MSAPVTAAAAIAKTMALYALIRLSTCGRAVSLREHPEIRGEKMPKKYRKIRMGFSNFVLF